LRQGQAAGPAEACYGENERRLAAKDDVNAILSTWVSSLDHNAVLATCVEFDVPASLV
jgi:crotonobetainyl-CoA:carnitine CoA-transferase CaiB-like acyl-CoA transferase